MAPPPWTKRAKYAPDAVILDVMMPGMDGFGLLRRLRADGIDSPALFLTARDTLQDKIAGLTLGGDDYVTKPFSLEEVVARLRVILRRSGRGAEEPRNARLTFADIELDEDTHEVVEGAASPFRCRRPNSPCCGTSSSTRAPCCRSRRSSTMSGDTTSAATSTSWSPMCPTCGARSTPARSVCFTRCGALDTCCANRDERLREEPRTQLISSRQ